MLAVERLSKRFGGFLAVNQVSFEVRQGEILGLIGPNGSGKTTFLRTAMGLIAPSEGRVTWGGVENAPPLRRAFAQLERAMDQYVAQAKLTSES